LRRCSCSSCWPRWPSCDDNVFRGRALRSRRTAGRGRALPLCSYDLRGLIEPRRPECGHRFDWDSLLDPAKRLHPYLFEHHARHNVWSFVRTLLAGLGAGAVARPPSPGDWFPDEVREAGGVQAWVDKEYPSWSTWRFLRAWDESYDVRRVLGPSLLYSAWPWVTLATLMIFPASMRRARVKPGHVLRCTIYTCDAGLWLGLITAAVVPAIGDVLLPRLWMRKRDIMLSAVFFAALTGYRLAAAYELYLRFDRPWATALASQGIVLLGALVGISLLMMWRF
jgi:hypothetical protein